MCGIFGYFSAFGAVPSPSDLLTRMAGALRHRGPDEGGFFHDGPIGLGSRRLAIVDLETGRQPLRNESGTVRIVCNGEIYNAPVLRRALEPRHTFATHSDVEVLVHLYEERGTDFLEDVEGMFALALWDSERRRLILARDRMGEKPLFYAVQNGTTYFASELTALRLADGIGMELDPAALRVYLSLGYFPVPHTPWRGIHKLAPGSMAVQEEGAWEPVHTRWWSLRDHAIEGARRRGERGGEAEGARVLRDTIERSVTRQLMSDVPLGVALSGGLDSALIASFAAKHSSAPIRTFTVSFADPSYDESLPAAEMATRLGAVQHVIRAGRPELIRALDTLAVRMDEPLGDPAVLPSFLLAEEARRHVKVILGGEGADELFGGYPTYLGHGAARAYSRWPAWLRAGIVRPLVEAIPASARKVTFEFLLKRFVRHADRPLLERHAAWFGVMPPGEAETLAGPLLRGPHDPSGTVGAFAGLIGVEADWEGSELAQITYLDALTYLGEGLLTKLDRVSMSCSLESRSPYLGREVVEMAAEMPPDWKVRRMATKRVLRDAARPIVPRSFIARQKRGLSVPLAGMFRHELRGLLLGELDPKRLDRDGILNGRAVGRLVAEHLDRRADRSRALWAVLSLVLWHRYHVIEGPRVAPVTPSRAAEGVEIPSA